MDDETDVEGLLPMMRSQTRAEDGRSGILLSHRCTRQFSKRRGKMKPRGIFCLMALLIVCFVVNGADGAPIYKERPIAQGIMQKYVANQAIIKLAPDAIDRVGLQPQVIHGRKEAVIDVTSGRIRAAALRQGLARLKAKHLSVTALSDAELIKRHYRTGKIGDFRFLREYVLIEFDEGVDFFGIASDLRAVVGVLGAYPNSCIVKPRATPNDTYYNWPNYDQWGLMKVSLPTVWDTYKGQNNINIIVGITEPDGVNLTHQDLNDNVAPNSQSGIYHNEPHGTMVAGVACAETNNSNAVAGATWNSRFIVSHSEGYTDWWSLIFMVNNIAHLCDVINYSWGIMDGATWTDDFWTGVDNLGTVQFGAVPNLAIDLDDPTYVDRPSEHPKVFPVGATNGQDWRASGTAKKAGMLYAPGAYIVTTSGTATNSNDVVQQSGTSLATPLVAGVAALMLVKNPSLTTEQCRSILLSSADIVTLNPFTGETGKRLNAANALAQTPSGSPKPAITSVSSLPNDYLLEQNFPNPFNATTSISFALPAQTSGEIKIYNLQGQEVRTMRLENLSAGRHSIRWDGLDNRGLSVSSGVYLYELRTQSGFFAKRKLVLLK
jgi:hypothetical protein